MSNELPAKRELPKRIDLAQAQGMLTATFSKARRFHPAMLLDDQMYAIGRVTVSTVKLEVFLIREGYDPEKEESMADFVRVKFGDYALMVINALIENLAR